MENKEKITLEFQEYEIQHIVKALNHLQKTYKGVRTSGYTNDLYIYADDVQKCPKWAKQIDFILRSIDRQIQPKYRIFGSEIDFELFVPENELKEKVKDIWNNPENYYNFKDCYYDFLKYLWIEKDGESERLAEYVELNKL